VAAVSTRRFVSFWTVLLRDLLCTHSVVLLFIAHYLRCRSPACCTSSSSAPAASTACLIPPSSSLHQATASSDPTHRPCHQTDPPPLQPVAMNLPKPPNSNSIFGRRRSLLRHHPSFFPVTPPIRFGIQIRDSDSICLQTACKLVEEGESLPLWARPPPITRQSQIKACIRVDFSCLFVFFKLG
jgi:hypothetical protein